MFVCAPCLHVSGTFDFSVYCSSGAASLVFNPSSGAPPAASVSVSVDVSSLWRFAVLLARFRFSLVAAAV